MADGWLLLVDGCYWLMLGKKKLRPQLMFRADCPRFGRLLLATGTLKLEGKRMAQAPSSKIQSETRLSECCWRSSINTLNRAFCQYQAVPLDTQAKPEYSFSLPLLSTIILHHSLLFFISIFLLSLSLSSILYYSFSILLYSFQFSMFFSPLSLSLTVQAVHLEPARSQVPRRTSGARRTSQGFPATLRVAHGPTSNRCWIMCHSVQLAVLFLPDLWLSCCYHGSYCSPPSRSFFGMVHDCLKSWQVF